MSIQESGEMYLETILILSKELRSVHAVNIGERMGYSKPSVSRAMGLLREQGYIKVDATGDITLTPEGRRIAERIYERHTTLAAVLVALGVDEKTADEDACKIEHYISDKTFNAVKKYIDNCANKDS